MQIMFEKHKSNKIKNQIKLMKHWTVTHACPPPSKNKFLIFFDPLNWLNG